MLAFMALMGVVAVSNDGAKGHDKAPAHIEIPKKQETKHEPKHEPKHEAEIKSDAKGEAVKVDFHKSPKEKDDGISLGIINRPNIDEDIKKAILSKNLESLLALLVGEYTNDAQVFFAPEIDGDKDAAKIFVNIKDNQSKNNEEGDISLKYQLNNENGKTIRYRKWQLSLDIGEFAIRVKQYDIDPIKTENMTYLKNCDILFQARGQGFTGRLEKNCKQTLNDGRIIDLLERHELDNKSWEISDLSTDGQKRQVFGNLDGFPTIYKKASYYVCWAGNYGQNASSTKTDILIHNQGGEAKLNLGGKNIRLRLREIEWPYGNNRPSLTLYLLTGNDDFAQIYSWADYGAQRIALSYGDIQASCTKK